MVPQKKAAEDRSQWLVKFSGRPFTSRPASTADTTPCGEADRVKGSKGQGIKGRARVQ